MTRPTLATRCDGRGEAMSDASTTALLREAREAFSGEDDDDHD